MSDLKVCPANFHYHLFDVSTSGSSVYDWVDKEPQSENTFSPFAENSEGEFRSVINPNVELFDFLNDLRHYHIQLIPSNQVIEAPVPHRLEFHSKRGT